MAKLFDMIVDLDFENVCRLCLSKNGVMSSIYDNSRKSVLCDRILSLASVQIMPDDGLPGLICHSCRDKVDKFVKFREQIENSYYLLCKSIGIDSTETESNSASEHVGSSLILPITSPTTGKVKKKQKEKPEENNIPIEQHQDLDPISILFKEHYLGSNVSSDLSVGFTNPADGFVSVDNISYANIPEDSDVYKNVDNCLSLLEVGDNLHLNQPDNVFSNVPKPGSSHSADKIFNGPFDDNPNDNPDDPEALSDIFQCLENDVSGFDDISKYLKSSQVVDFKKLKEEIKSLKIKNESNTYTIDTNSDQFIKKLADRGVTLLKQESAAEFETPPENTVIPELKPPNEYQVSTSNQAEPNMIHPKNTQSQKYTKDDELPQVLVNGHVHQTPSTEDILQADLLFPKMEIEAREDYAEANYQEEIVPRITEIYTTFIQTDSAEPKEVKYENLYTYSKFMCHLCLVIMDNCDYNTLKEHSDCHFQIGNAVNQSEAPFTCEICGKVYENRHEFVIHQRDHMHIKPFVCTVCYKEFSWTVKLAEHTARHTSQQKGLDTFTCSKCGELFHKKQELLCHERTHIPKNSLICSICNKTFSSSITLRMHRRRHTEGTKYSCELCGKSFFYKTELHRHEQLHSGVRQFPCHLCDKAFCSNAERRRHLLYHFKTKKFKCLECDKRFYESGHLSIHMRAHTNFKPHICEVCGKGFPTRIKLIRHLKMHSRDSPTPSELRDQMLLETQMYKTTAKAKTVVVPKLNALTPMQANLIRATSILQPQVVSDDTAMITDDLNLQDMNGDDEEQSFLIIEEGDESNGGDSSPDLSAFNGVQMFTDDSGEVFYILDGEDIEGFNLENFSEQNA